MNALEHIPGDPALIDAIVAEVKSQGAFDQFRRECMADVDTKPAYQNLRQRVETSVASFLGAQHWAPDQPKNQTRERLRRHINETSYLDTGVERIVDQVVNPKINTVFLSAIEDISYAFMCIDKPRPSLADLFAAAQAPQPQPLQPPPQPLANGVPATVDDRPPGTERTVLPPLSAAEHDLDDDLEAVSSPDSDKTVAADDSRPAAAASACAAGTPPPPDAAVGPPTTANGQPDAVAGLADAPIDVDANDSKLSSISGLTSIGSSNPSSAASFSTRPPSSDDAEPSLRTQRSAFGDIADSDRHRIAASDRHRIDGVLPDRSGSELSQTSQLTGSDAFDGGAGSGAAAATPPDNHGDEAQMPRFNETSSPLSGSSRSSPALRPPAQRPPSTGTAGGASAAGGQRCSFVDIKRADTLTFEGTRRHSISADLKAEAEAAQSAAAAAAAVAAAANQTLGTALGVFADEPAAGESSAASSPSSASLACNLVISETQSVPAKAPPKPVPADDRRPFDVSASERADEFQFEMPGESLPPPAEKTPSAQHRSSSSGRHRDGNSGRRHHQHSAGSSRSGTSSSGSRRSDDKDGQPQHRHHSSSTRHKSSSSGSRDHKRDASASKPRDKSSSSSSSSSHHRSSTSKSHHHSSSRSSSKGSHHHRHNSSSAHRHSSSTKAADSASRPRTGEPSTAAAISQADDAGSSCSQQKIAEHRRSTDQDSNDDAGAERRPSAAAAALGTPIAAADTDSQPSSTGTNTNAGPVDSDAADEPAFAGFSAGECRLSPTTRSLVRCAVDLCAQSPGPAMASYAESAYLLNVSDRPALIAAFGRHIAGTVWTIDEASGQRQVRLLRPDPLAEIYGPGGPLRDWTADVRDETPTDDATQPMDDEPQPMDDEQQPMDDEPQPMDDASQSPDVAADEAQRGKRTAEPADAGEPPVRRRRVERTPPRSTMAPMTRQSSGRLTRQSSSSLAASDADDGADAAAAAAVVSPTPSDRSAGSKENKFVPKIKKAVSRSLAHQSAAAAEAAQAALAASMPLTRQSPRKAVSSCSTGAVAAGPSEQQPLDVAAQQKKKNQQQQRYASDDLYKPRPTVLGSRSRRRGAALEASSADH